MSASAAPAPRSLRIAVVGDVHDQWDGQDEVALGHLGVDLVLLVGDFGNEAIEVVAQVATLPFPKAVIFGNHDAWYTATDWGRRRCPPEIRQENRFERQLALLGADHVGYGKRDFPELGLTVVGGRPFSWGGGSWQHGEFYRQYFGVDGWEESAARICQAADAATQETLIFIGHCGPKGLGSAPESPCGRDWKLHGGDYGDPDLQTAIAHSQAQGKAVPLVAFGHMHHHLRHRQDRLRDAWAMDTHGTAYLNAARVPRIVPQGEGWRRNFSLVTLEGGKVTAAALVWVDQSMAIVAEEPLFPGPSYNGGIAP